MGSWVDGMTRVIGRHQQAGALGRLRRLGRPWYNCMRMTALRVQSVIQVHRPVPTSHSSSRITHSRAVTKTQRTAAFPRCPATFTVLGSAGFHARAYRTFARGRPEGESSGPGMRGLSSFQGK